MSIAREGLHPPGTAKIRTPSPADPCFSITSLNFLTAFSVRLTILPPGPVYPIDLTLNSHSLQIIPA
jgi:hypothetical protein